MKIAYVTDSVCVRSIDEMAKDQIFSLPLQIAVDNKNFFDIEQVSIGDVIKALKEDRELSSSLPALGLIDSLFKKLKEEGFEKVIAVPICKGLSGTMNALYMTGDEYDLPVSCIDTYVTAVVEEYLIKYLKTAISDKGLNEKEALENGLDKLSALNMPGYAAVMVDNGSHKLRDILILDIKKERVISLHQSQGRALARLAAKRRQAWREKHPQLAARLDKQGFALDAKRVMITKDGITWAPLPHGEIRRNLVYAWEWGWYAKFKHGSWQVEGFAEKKGEPLQPQVPALKVVF